MKINDKYEISPFGNAFDSLFSLLSRSEQSHPLSQDPFISAQEKVRIKEDEKEIKIEFLVPGIKKSDLSLNIEDQKLTLCSNEEEKKQGNGWFKNNELNYQVRLGQNLDTSKILAKLEEGVLSVTIPISKRVKGRNIKIN